MNISFTGHRNYDKEHFAELLRSVIIDSTNNEPSTLYSGMALGFDLAAAETVITLRDEGYALQLCCVIPFRGQSQSFYDEDKVRYNTVLSRADRVVTLEEEYQAGTYYRRNDYLVEQADCIITFYEGKSSGGKIGAGGTGGTAYTLRKARTAHRKIINISAEQSTQLALF